MVVFHQKMSRGAHTHVLLAGSSAYFCWKAATLQKKPHSAVNNSCFCEDQSTALIYLFSLCTMNALMTGAGQPKSPLSLQNATFPQDRALQQPRCYFLQAANPGNFSERSEHPKWSCTSSLQTWGVPTGFFQGKNEALQGSTAAKLPRHRLSRWQLQPRLLSARQSRSPRLERGSALCHPPVPWHENAHSFVDLLACFAC